MLSESFKSVAQCKFNDEEPELAIPVEIVFIFKFAQDEAGAPKLISTVEFMDSLAMMKVVERQTRGRKV